jgi:hypothetical protein
MESGAMAIHQYFLLSAPPDLSFGGQKAKTSRLEERIERVPSHFYTDTSSAEGW